MNHDINKRNFIAQGSILAATGIVVRIIGMFYRIPLIAVISTAGNGYYTSAYSIYNILLILSSYSLPTAVSKIISVRLASGRYDDVRTVLRVSFIYATLMGGGMCLTMYLGAGSIARFMEKPFCEYALRALAPTIWVMAYLGVLRGYFQGSGNMVPTAVSQILEQIVNAVVSIVMAILLFDYGAKADLIYNETQYSYAYGAAGGTFGTGAGALTALLFFILLFLLYGRLDEGNGVKKLRRSSVRDGNRRAKHVYVPIPREKTSRVAAILILTLLPILVSSTVYNISTVLDDFIFSRMMASLGLASGVVLLWGVYGEYRILFNIPVAMANSMSSSLIPSLTHAASVNDHDKVVQKINLSIQFVMMLSIPAAVGLFVLAEPICRLLFASEDHSLLVNVLRIGAPAIVLYSLSTITNGILQGLGYLSDPLKNACIALVIHIAVLAGCILVFRDLSAVIIASTVFALAVCILNSLRLHQHVSFRTSIQRTYVKPLLASIIMGAAVWLIDHVVSYVMPAIFSGGKAELTIRICICIAAALPFYLILLVQLGSFTKEELIEMPMGLRVYRFVHRLGLL